MAGEPPYRIPYHLQHLYHAMRSSGIQQHPNFFAALIVKAQQISKIVRYLEVPASHEYR